MAKSLLFYHKIINSIIIKGGGVTLSDIVLQLF